MAASKFLLVMIIMVMAPSYHCCTATEAGGLEVLAISKEYFCILGMSESAVYEAFKGLGLSPVREWNVVANSGILPPRISKELEDLIIRLRTKDQNIPIDNNESWQRAAGNVLMTFKFSRIPESRKIVFYSHRYRILVLSYPNDG